MKATFNGVPGEDLSTIHMYGQDFPLGKAVKVNTPLAIRKLANHPHFTATQEDSEQAQDVQIKSEFTAAANAALAPVEEAHVDPEPTPAPTPAPTEPPVVVESAQEWQDRFEKGPIADAPNLNGATNGNSDRAGEASAGQAEGARRGRNAGRSGSRQG